MSLAARILLFAIRAYQAFFSPIMPSACKFYPTCSHYGAEAVRIHGARCGSWLALRRFLRCHPFSRGGVDFVPDREEFARDRALDSDRHQNEEPGVTRHPLAPKNDGPLATRHSSFAPGSPAALRTECRQTTLTREVHL